MENTLEGTDNEIIRENADYVLGMYDMYGSDQEIVNMLKMKGLNDSIVQRILTEVRTPAFVKRVKQAKVMIGIGSGLLIGFVLIPYLVIHYTDSDVLIPSGQENALTSTETYTGRGDGMLTVVLRFLMRIELIVVVLGLSQLAIGIYSFFKYKRLLKAS